MLDAGADADVEELLAGHTDGGARLDDTRLHSHSHHNWVPAHVHVHTHKNYISQEPKEQGCGYGISSPYVDRNPGSGFDPGFVKLFEQIQS